MSIKKDNSGICVNNALIVLNYNDSETTIRFLQMALNVLSIGKIIVVDNCSTDDSFNILKGYSEDRVDVIQTDYNGGYAYGNNFGCIYAIKMYNPMLLFIANPDTQFDDKAIWVMQEMLVENQSLGAIAPIVNRGYNAWRLPSFWGVIESTLLICFSIEKKIIKNKLLASKDDMVIVGAIEGSFWAVRKDVFLEVGGLDPRTFLYYEENIFSKRLQERGYFVAICTKARYNHAHSVSIKKTYGCKTKAYKNFKSGMIIYLSEYLRVKKLGIIIFEIAYALGYIERVIYDALNYMIMSRE